ncbi:acyltransferase family protein [Runella salmonicolor]|uniref:Heparan-alpha-glucosaminide N-acetyltransferase domain-containing protein n=1 Tax=Runella salmonicolor TaxID=2950278 RepID=A0ABT1FP50_9BACT|nr:heparan-alpha-glucosaminide N-acetyltransferase domain-containing protein [Runella salmonicolor]MCP1383545.1 heparan-alpha-glucosaminide N-acetyltransferase domain-containing protein [Runella salmonicolor]
MQNRLLSLDVFRGMTVAAMILVNNPGDWEHVYAPLLHAHWHGCTPTDLIFPFFLFIVGVSISFAMAKTTPSIPKIIKRSLILFGLGLFLNLYPKFDFANVRIPGVLQRIALVYLVCSLIFIKTSRNTQIITTIILLSAYWLLMTLVPVPGIGYANLEPTTNLGAWVDRNLLTTAHLWRSAKVWDPEGIFSTIPAIGTGMLGVLTGQWLRSQRTDAEKMAWLFLWGNALIIGGLIWNEFFPINKSLWTSSFVLYAGGWAMVALAICYWLIDVQGYRRWTAPFVAFGVNAITVFFLSGIIPRTLPLFKINTPEGPVGSQVWMQKNLISVWFNNPYNASLAGALTFITIWFVILYVMYKKGIIIKV